ncbi:helix-turn-helix transcriptional regulator [Gymnodinialimonas hymeniacidonis]|uniref:helix-turn-helix transcriptional regulator n=1 Tax=Gymnodinialimonas hymeniacidonis TaxID=3126508 RepID=UPI0034C645B1
MPSRPVVLWSLFAVQALCCAYFLYDITLDFVRPGSVNSLADSDIVEGIVTVTLFLGLAFTATELRRALGHQTRLTEQLQVASGAFQALLDAKFAEWALTSAERDVALLAIKGYSIAEIADLRQTAQGTAKAQAASVYRKADVSGRLQLISLFLDDLMNDALLPGAQEAVH